MTCIENSPFVNRFNKIPAFAINFVSIMGFPYSEEAAKIKRRTRNYIQAEQEKTGLEILAKICSSNFSSVLSIIANEPRTVDKIKSQFDKLTALVRVKRSLIEPIFIAFSKYNPALGDWMIKQLLVSDNFRNVATLTANLIMSEAQEIPQRLSMLQEHMQKRVDSADFNAAAL